MDLSRFMPSKWHCIKKYIDLKIKSLDSAFIIVNLHLVSEKIKKTLIIK